MLCCKRKKHEYAINPEDDPNVVKLNDIEQDDKNNEKPDIGKSNGVVEAPIEAAVSDKTEVVKRQTSPKVESDKPQTGSTYKEDPGEKTVDEKVKNPRYVSQMSMCSTLSVREEINRSREMFFSETSLNNPSLQEEDWTAFNKRLSRTDDKFAEYQRRLRTRKRLAEEEEMSAEQMQQAVSRLEAVASRLESLAVANPKPSTSSSSDDSGPDPGKGEVVFFVKLQKHNYCLMYSLMSLFHR